jgi:hypothetical protein
MLKFIHLKDTSNDREIIVQIRRITHLEKIESFKTGKINHYVHIHGDNTSALVTEDKYNEILNIMKLNTLIVGEV